MRLRRGYLAGSRITAICTQVARYSHYALIAIGLLAAALAARQLRRPVPEPLTAATTLQITRGDEPMTPTRRPATAVLKLLLTWFRDTERIPPQKLRLADIDRPRILRFLDWLENEQAARPPPATSDWR